YGCLATNVVKRTLFSNVGLVRLVTAISIGYRCHRRTMFPAGWRGAMLIATYPGGLDAGAYRGRYARTGHNRWGGRLWERRKAWSSAAVLAACSPPRSWRGADATCSTSS